MPESAPSFRVSVRLYVVFSLLMAVSATASGLTLLYLAKPFITELGGPVAARATVVLFAGAALAGGFAAVGGLILGLFLRGRIRGIVERAEALVPVGARGNGNEPARDEFGALDAAVGRLSLSMDRFIRDSDILARLPEGMLLLGPEGELISFNTTAEVLLELSLDRFRGLPVLSLQGPFPTARGNEALAAMLDDAMVAQRALHLSEIAVVTSRDQTLLLEVTVQHREWGQGSTALVLLIRDASEKRRIRDEIRRADQLAFLGGMAARVAHEIRTPLAAIRGLMELLQSDLAAGDPRREYIDRVLLAVDRQDRLVEDLLTLSNPEPETWAAIGLVGLLQDVAGMLPADPRLRLLPADGIAPTVWGDAFRLSEVFSNLVKNALEATPASGKVEIHVDGLDPDRTVVTVRNTGVGIPAEIRERIFQPFFTTKSRGTGLGLAIARQIVESHRGTIRVESDGRHETAFVVELPTTMPAAAVVRQA
jgi:signal transduction histidine kinase